MSGYNNNYNNNSNDRDRDNDRNCVPGGGNSGYDTLNGTSRNDTLDGRGGNDKVYGNSGNDVLVYKMSENAGAKDIYDGGRGTDTLRLQFTAAEWQKASVQTDVARFLDSLDSCRDGRWFEFKAFDLKVTDIEKLEVWVDGVRIDPRDECVDAVNDKVSVKEDASVSGNVLANDSVPDLVKAVALVDGPDHGALTLDAKGNFVYTPGSYFDSLAAGKTATETFKYKVTDADGDSDTATVTITITGTNDGPVAKADAYATGEDDLLTVSATKGVLANDSDIDKGDVLKVSSTGTLTSQMGATVKMNQDGSFTYDGRSAAAVQALNNGQTAVDSFSYTVGDGNGGTATQTVKVTVTGKNDAANHAPEAYGAQLSFDEDTSVTLTRAQLGRDVDAGDTLTWTFGVPAHGQLVVNANGSVTYTPNGNYNGNDSFSYTIRDQHGATATATVAINVVPVNDAPALAAPLEGQTLNIGDELVLTVPADAFTDVEGDALTYAAALGDGSPLPAWMTFDAQTGTFSGVAGEGDAGVYVVRLTATDANGASASTTFEIAVPDAHEIIGTPGEDVLAGTSGDDRILGLGSDDRIDGGLGNDVVDGGEGNDDITVRSGTHTVTGGAGNDVIHAQDTAGSLQGGAGDDEIHAQDAIGSVQIGGGTGNDAIFARNLQAGSSIDAGTGADTVALYEFNGNLVDLGADQDSDTLAVQSWVDASVNDPSASSVIEVRNFDAGADVFDFSGFAGLNGWDDSANPFGSGYIRLVQSGADTLVQVDTDGPDGGDYGYQTMLRLTGVNADDLGSANFVPAFDPDGGSTPGVTINGDAGDNEYSEETTPGTTNGDDTVNGGAGNDSISGGGGNDTLDGGGDDDSLYGEAGNDTLRGGAGADYMDGGSGVDLLEGGDGDDYMESGEGSDTLLGEGGNDTLIVASGSGVVDGGADDDTIYAFYGEYEIIGGSGNDIFLVQNPEATSSLDAGTGADEIAMWGFLGIAVDLGADADVDALIPDQWWTVIPNGPAMVENFTAGVDGDMVDLSRALFEHFDHGTSLAEDFVSLTTDGQDTTVYADLDGSGGDYAMQALFVLQGVTGLTVDGMLNDGNLVV